MTWFNSTAGKSLLELEASIVQSFLEEKFGYYALQINFPEFNFLSTSRIKNHLFSDGNRKNIDFLVEALPFDSDSLDLVVCPHLLEQIKDKQQFFDELYRIVIPNGYCLLWSFNPFSFAGIRHSVGFDNNFPWNSNFMSSSFCQQLLKSRGFVIEEAKIFNYQPIFFDDKDFYSPFFESIGDRWFPLLGNVYCILARKDVPGMTPIKPKWKKEKSTRAVTNKT
jgi:SAM-dependent methyltransferase